MFLKRYSFFSAAFLLLFFYITFSVNLFAQVANRPPRTFDVQHYIIRTNFDHPNKTVIGETTIQLKPIVDNFKEFALDAVGLQVQSVTLEKANVSLPFNTKNDKLNITLDQNYGRSETIAMRIKYRAVKPRAGITFVNAKTIGKIVRPAQIWTQGEPEENRFWFPSYDFPDDKATTEQFITTSADETAIANGELVDVKTNPKGTKTFHYRMTVPHSTYLVSLVVGKYAKATDTYNNIPLGFYVYPGTESVVPRAYGKTKKMMALMEELTNVKFPYNKYDQTVVGDFTFGGMENITATTMADTEIYAAEKSDNPRDTEVLVMHELAHSWFGDLVTCKDWSNLWLNEGFATFFESAFLEREYGRDAYLNEMRRNAAQYFIEELFVKHPLLNPRAQPNILLFDATTYKKGGFVAHMLRETVGDEMFWKSLNNYLNKHRFGNVESSDLQRAFEETTGKNLDWFFDQWVRKAGFPNLLINPVYDGITKKLTLNIKQTQKPDSQTPEVFRFNAEIGFVTPAGEKTEKIEMNAREQNFTFDLAAKPTRIYFDKREQVLKKVEMEEISETKQAAALVKN